MAALLEEFPRIRANFNLVPSLLAQLDDYAAEQADDRFVAVTLKPAAQLSFDDKSFLLQNFFMANWERMIDPHPRFRELLDKRGHSAGTEDFPRLQAFFHEADWRDLQVWFNLSWMDPLWLEREPWLAALRQKGMNFSEEEKRRLVERQRQLCGEVVPIHRRLQDRGQIEISATPFYHPILPLLCDTDAAHVATPDMALPRRFRHPEDAREQIRRAMEDHERRFGRPPRGFWPSEGSVSPEVAGLFMESGVRWIATDEAVLFRSETRETLTRQDLYQPWYLEQDGRRLNLFFRDHTLSDAIGFVYASWEPADAAKDFVQRLLKIRDELAEPEGTNSSPHVVPIILDGENCWEYYRDDGLPFLRELYTLLSETPELETVLASDYLDRHPPTARIDRLFSASWINGNFSIWIGHAEDNRAWDLLQKAREFYESQTAKNPSLKISEAGRLAWEEILIAEGSDWCWWYGDDHSTMNDATFDWLFRKHLMNVYTLMGHKPPEELTLPIKAKKSAAAVLPPTDFLNPTLDGRVTSYFEWFAAGIYRTQAGASGTMHRVENWIQTLYYGFDLKNLYFRMDFSKPLGAKQMPELAIRWLFLQPEGLEIDLRFPEGRPTLWLKQGDHLNALPASAKACYDKVLEVGLPLASIQPGLEPIRLLIAVLVSGQEQERWPSEQAITIPLPTAHVFAESWRV